MFSRSLIKSTLRASRAFTPATVAACRGFHSSQAVFAISVSDASSLPSDYNEMNNDVIQIMAVDGDMKAKEERLRRNIMKVDQVEWDAANNTVHTRTPRTLTQLPSPFCTRSNAYTSPPLLRCNTTHATNTPVPRDQEREPLGCHDPEAAVLLGSVRGVHHGLRVRAAVL